MDLAISNGTKIRLWRDGDERDAARAQITAADPASGPEGREPRRFMLRLRLRAVRSSGAQQAQPAGASRATEEEPGQVQIRRITQVLALPRQEPETGAGAVAATQTNAELPAGQRKRGRTEQDSSVGVQMSVRETRRCSGEHVVPAFLEGRDSLRCSLTRFIV